jgi:phenylpropionate dioxygenase-like ring-hydroxylating dioxygenase large terminal subunit
VIGAFVDAAYIEDIKARSAYETARTGPPDGFPAFPVLPLGRYTDPAFFALEQEHLWKKSWLYAVHDSDLPTVGSYRLCDIAGAPVLMVRGEDGAVRAFFNACRHRGAPVVRGESGSARMLVCQYHSWGYDLQGCLQRVPDERDFVGLDRSTLGLPPVRCESWGGWHFVTLDPTAVPLLEFLHPLPTVLAEVAAAPLRVIDRKTVTVRCNWKILAEGFLEVYHARTIHPQTVGGRLDTRGTVISLFDQGHQSMISPLTATAQANGRGDGREALAGFEGATELFFTANSAHGIFPNVITPLDARGFPFLVFWPAALDQTRLDIIWFAADWGDGPNPNQAVWDRRLAAFDIVMDEDYANLEPIQRSMESAAHPGQVLNYQERRIWHVHTWIDKTIGPGLISPDLRVPDLLTPWTEQIG